MARKYTKNSNGFMTAKKIMNQASDVNNLLDHAKSDIDKLLLEIYGIDGPINNTYDENDIELIDKDFYQNKLVTYITNDKQGNKIIN